MLGRTTDAPTSEVEEAESLIRGYKENVEEYETRANEQEAKLNQGWYTVFAWSDAALD